MTTPNKVPNWTHTHTIREDYQTVHTKRSATRANRREGLEPNTKYREDDPYRVLRKGTQLYKREVTNLAHKLGKWEKKYPGNTHGIYSTVDGDTLVLPNSVVEEYHPGPSEADVIRSLGKDLKAHFPIGPYTHPHHWFGAVSYRDLENKAKCFGLAYTWGPPGSWYAFNWRKYVCQLCGTKPIGPGYHKCPEKKSLSQISTFKLLPLLNPDQRSTTGYYSLSIDEPQEDGSVIHMFYPKVSIQSTATTMGHQDHTITLKLVPKPTETRWVYGGKIDLPPVNADTGWTYMGKLLPTPTAEQELDRIRGLIREIAKSVHEDGLKGISHRLEEAIRPLPPKVNRQDGMVNTFREVYSNPPNLRQELLRANLRSRPPWLGFL